jgi:hypothetical protein
MEPSEASALPVPGPEALEKAWGALSPQSSNLDAALRRGEWWTVVADVDRVLLKGALGLDNEEVLAIRDAATLLRVRRTRQAESYSSAAKT